MIGPIKALKAARAMLRITMDPTRLDEVFVLADAAEESPQLEEMVAELRSDPRFGAVFRDRPRLSGLDQDALHELPEGTVGRAYAEFMGARGLRHEDLVLLDDDGTDAGWLRNHLRETHDLWHVATGFDSDVAGELGLQAFYLAQVRSPLPVMILTVGMLNTLVREIGDADRRIEAIARGWLLGRRAASLFGVRWADRWEQSVEAFRAELGLDVSGVDAYLAPAETPTSLDRAA